MSKGITRRTALAILPGTAFSAAEKAARQSRPLPQVGEFVRLTDPTTETTVVRLTNPAFKNLLPAETNRFILSEQKSLLFSSDRGSGLAPYMADLRTGTIRAIAGAAGLNARSLTADAQGRSAFFLDSAGLNEVELSGRRTKQSGFGSLQLTDFAVGASRAQLFGVGGGQLLELGGSSPVLLAKDAQGPCVMQPGGTGCLFERAAPADERQIWYGAAGAKPKLIASGRLSSPCWSSDGQALLFLRGVPIGDAVVSEIRRVALATGIEQQVSKTSQFAAFAPNGDDSVFVGASDSKAQPNVIILLASARRELTLCEHRASRASEVTPVFSPDSRRVYFQSDREGKPAIYSVNVELLVEPTQA